MSVLVKGMKMPKSCGRCWFNDSSLSCAITGSCIDRDDEYGDRLDDCPIVALPDKHGRLVDADAMLSCLEEWNTSDSTDKALYNFTLHRILEQPTIEPQRKKGKWINVRHDNIAECDQCGITGRAWMNFCFDCGADMREPEDIPMEYFESGGK